MSCDDCFMYLPARLITHKTYLTKNRDCFIPLKPHLTKIEIASYLAMTVCGIVIASCKGWACPCPHIKFTLCSSCNRMPHISVPHRHEAIWYPDITFPHCPSCNRLSHISVIARHEAIWYSDITFSSLTFTTQSKKNRYCFVPRNDDTETLIIPHYSLFTIH
jgi:hypothetical protein